MSYLRKLNSHRDGVLEIGIFCQSTCRFLKHLVKFRNWGSKVPLNFYKPISKTPSMTVIELLNNSGSGIALIPRTSNLLPGAYLRFDSRSGGHKLPTTSRPAHRVLARQPTVAHTSRPALDSRGLVKRVRCGDMRSSASAS